MKNKVVFGFGFVLYLFACPLNFLVGQSVDTVQIAPFKNLEVIGRIDVNLVVSEKEKLILNYEGIDREKIDVTNENGTLKIKIITLSYKGVRVLVDLHITEPEKLGAYSSAVILSDETITQDSIKLEAEGGGEVVLKLFVDKLTGSASTGGILNLSGKASENYSKVVTRGTLSAIDLLCQRYFLEVNSKGVAKIQVSEKLECTASSWGYVSYKGNPEEMKIETRIGAKVKKLGD